MHKYSAFCQDFQAFPKHGWTPKDISASLSRLKQGFDSPRERHLPTNILGLSKMVDEDRYCIDIVTQISAVRAALRRVEEEVLRDHVSHCVEHAITSGNKADQRAKIAELMAVIGRIRSLIEIKAVTMYLPHFHPLFLWPRPYGNSSLMTSTGTLLRIFGAAILLIAVQFASVAAKAHVGHSHGPDGHESSRAWRCRRRAMRPSPPRPPAKSGRASRSRELSLPLKPSRCSSRDRRSKRTGRALPAPMPA